MMFHSIDRGQIQVTEVDLNLGSDGGGITAQMHQASPIYGDDARIPEWFMFLTLSPKQVMRWLRWRKQSVGDK